MSFDLAIAFYLLNRKLFGTVFNYTDNICNRLYSIVIYYVTVTTVYRSVFKRFVGDV